jgi:hypothetical protein
MRKARRRFFIGSALACVLSRVAPSRAASPPSAALADATLRAYVDVLLPADETPSGTALGVDRHLLLVARKQRSYQRLLDLGLDWLNRQARAEYGRDFPRLDDGERETVVHRAAAAGYNTLPRVFFQQTRADAFTHYYGRPESWRGIEQYRGPPQPLGFMDYTRPPHAAR